MSLENVKSFASAAFRIKLEKAVAAKTVSDAEFADIVYTAVSQFGVNETKFRDAFGLTEGAVERWSQLKNLPQPIIRAKILVWISQNI